MRGGRHAAGGYTWTPPSLQGLCHIVGEKEKIADIHPAFRRTKRFGPDECAGWFLYKSASSKLVIHARFDQPGPTCLAINDRLPKQPLEEICGVVPTFGCSASYATSFDSCIGSYTFPEDSSAQAMRAFLLAMATAAML